MSPLSRTPQQDAPEHDQAGRGPGDGRAIDEPTGPPYRAIAMVLLAAVVVAIGIGLAQLFSGDDSTPAADEASSSQQEQQQGAADGQQAPAGGEGAAGQPGEGQPAQDGQQPPADAAPEGQPAGAPQAPPVADAAAGSGDVTTVPVRIYNNSNISGLAGRTGDQLRDAGFAVSDISNYPSTQGVMPESAAFYGTGPGEQQAAQAVADQLGIPARPRPAGLAESTPGVIVIVTQDLNR